MKRPAVVIALALVAIGFATPSPVLADNGASLKDLWAVFDILVFAGFATPLLLWLASTYPPPEPPLMVEPPPETYPPDLSNTPYKPMEIPDDDDDPSWHPASKAPPPPPPPPPRGDSIPDGLDELEVQR